MKCPYCKKSINKKAAFCPECGKAIKQKNKKTKASWMIFFLVICLSGGGILYMSNSDDGFFTAAEQKIYAENGDYVYHPTEDSISMDEDTFEIFYEDLLIVYLKDNMPEEEREQLAKSVGGKLVGNLSGCMNIIEILIQGSSGYAELEKTAEELMKNDAVVYASTEIPMIMDNSTAENNTDPWKSENTEIIDQDNNADESNPDGNDWWAEAIQAYSAWEYVDSGLVDPADIKIAVIDDGLDKEHEDFSVDGSSKIRTLPGYESNQPKDHGTHVTGLLTAENNTVGIRGIADKAELYFVGCEEEDLFSTGEYVTVTKRLIDKEVYVINNSWGSVVMDKKTYLNMVATDKVFAKKALNRLFLDVYDMFGGLYENYETYISTLVKREAADTMLMMFELFLNQKKDFLIVQSAGNGYNSSLEPLPAEMNGMYASVTQKSYDALNKNGALSAAGYSYDFFKEHIIIVGAAQLEDNGYRLTDFSNYGSTVDIVAPGLDIYSTVTIKDDYIDENNNNIIDGLSYSNKKGTSMAAPMVTGSAALVWSVNPELSAGEVKELLISTANTAVKSAKEDTRQEYPMLNVGEAVKKAISDKKGATSVKYEVFQENIEINGYPTTGEYAVVKGYDDFEQEIWEYKSDTIPMSELMTVYEIGVHSGKYYIVIGGVLHVFEVSDGKELWSFDQCEAVVSHDFDEKNNLFVCGYYGPDFCEISSTGELLKKIDCFYDDYYWPFELHYNEKNNTVDVLMEGTPTGEIETITVNLEDYTYAVATSEGSQNAEEIELAKRQLLSRTFDLHQKDESAPAYAAIDLSRDGINEIIIRTFTSQATEGGRYIYEVYHYDKTSKSYSCSSEKIFSFAYDALLYDKSTDRLAVNWTFADEYYFTIYAYDNFELTVIDEVNEDLSYLPAVTFTDITAVDKVGNAEREASLMFTNIFDSFPQVFVFTSGVGAWQTEIRIVEDGTFTGEYSDMNGDEIYICEFTGEFSDLKKIDNYTYSMQIASLDYLTAIGDEYYEDGYLYIGKEPVGFDKKGQCMLYLPGCATAGLPEDFLDWAWIAGDISEKLPFYGIYNIETSGAFFAETP